MSDLISELIFQWQKEAPELDTSAMNIVGRLIILGDLLQQNATRELSVCDLSYREFDVLATLRRSGPPYELTPGKLANSVLLTSGAMTACLNRLEARKLISRSASSTDRREVNVCLTAEGKELALKAAKIRFAEAQSGVFALNDDQKKQLTEHLEILLSELTDIC